MQSELDDLAATIIRYRDSDQEDQARKLEKTNRNKLAVRRDLNRYARKISTLRKDMRKIMDNRFMSAKVKRQKIDRLNREISKLSAEAVGKYGK